MSETSQQPYTSHPGDHRRLIGEPLVTPLDVAAFVVALVMVCGPLAFGAFSL